MDHNWTENNRDCTLEHVRFGPVLLVRDLEVPKYLNQHKFDFEYGIADELLEQADHEVVQLLGGMNRQWTELQPGSTVRAELLRIQGPVPTDLCSSHIHSMEGLLPGLPGLLLAWEAGWLPMDGVPVLGLGMRGSIIPWLSRDSGGDDLGISCWTPDGVAHEGHYVLLFRKV